MGLNRVLFKSPFSRGLCINRNDWQNPIFAQLVISLNLVLAELRLGLKNHQVGEKWVYDDYSYLCKGLFNNVHTISSNTLSISFIGFVANHFHFGKGVSFDRIGNNNPLV
ncbi:hypothetical protein BSPWISOX_905 [uncultured Gammaproteobacteria bacterium]|nr:hypothetical protein [uncultured Gammaproteobacteria bacterium]VVH56704.1 hypothetical protein BSPCLSOX_1682 [uncultured Gammaproteobacteria bacterium]VVH62975.1 hypothetical protein BSPWISOX_905 [uncultured Gammaproteobacteria bacterium]